MKLPRADAAIVQERKIVDYLLNLSHPRGAAKARFFGSLGFRADRWEELAKSLRHVAEHSPVAASLETVHGWKYIVDGEIETPSGRRAAIRTVWIVDHVDQPPRLVTAFPNE